MSNRKKRFSYTAGEKGRNRVRAFEEAKTGILFLEWYENRHGEEAMRRRRSLGHRDQARAKRQADQVAAEIAKGQWVSEEPLTLQELFDIYLVEKTPEKGGSKQEHDRRCVEMFNRFFGAKRRAETLNQRDWDCFRRERRRGDIAPAGSRSRTGVGDRVIAYDLKFLVAVLNWATKARDESGEPLLTHNPLKGCEYPKEASPNRPIVSDERYRSMLTVAPEVDWRFHVALVLAHETGHRIKAIRLLRWCDVDLNDARITWPARNDKIGREHSTPITPEAQMALELARRQEPGVGEAWILPAPEDGTKPCSRHIMRDWWRGAEELAELDHVKGLGWHGLRRKFATELKGEPLTDLCHLGGWKDPQTILKCYQKPDEETMRKALMKRRKVAGLGS